MGISNGVKGLFVEGKKVVGEQSAHIPDLAVTFTTNTPTPSNTQTIANGTTPTVAELGQFAANVEAKLQAIIDVLRAHGLIASS